VRNFQRVKLQKFSSPFTILIQFFFSFERLICILLIMSELYLTYLMFNFF